MAQHFKTSGDAFPEQWDEEPDGLDVDPDELESLFFETRQAAYGSDGDPMATPQPVPAAAPVVTQVRSGSQIDSYVPVVGPDPDEGKRRTKHGGESAYVEADPYNLDGSQSGKKKGRRRVRLVSNVLFIAGILMLLVAGYMWGKQQWAYHEQDVEIERLQGYAKVEGDGNQPPTVDWGALKAVNQEAVGWIQIPGTVVNYPVYYGESNEDYLRTNAEGEYAVGGQLFLDYLNTSPGMIDHQSIIYGHHLYNGTMFKTIADMDNQQMFDSVKTIWYVTETATYELEPLFLYYTNADDTNARRFEFPTNGAFQDYLLDILHNKGVTQVADAEQVIGVMSHALTLATCNYYDGSGRTLLVCVPKGEAAPVRAANAQ